ncbi:PDZ and LIM domain protein 4-like isoform X2 [Malaya genurostris]|uniref:PDZ and LIM domain protein 4-like isoform X2 n=1 Tax=Malaya genurostris TaxID=325434 RepID=UPI0026F3B2EE|nr:PDZ and LIM domain protein 4-like isoform X2 [Malaya genurostris]
MPEFVLEKRNIPVLTIASNRRNSGAGGDGQGTGENPLGFRITGGVDFEMPITIFQVKENSPAAKAGLALGDQIVTINGADASAMRLATAESVIKQAGEQLQLVVAKDDEESAKTPEKPKETRVVKFAGIDDDTKADVTNNTPAPKLKPDEERANWIQPPERKVWHPIVWQQPPPPIPPDVYGKDAPHQRLIANIRRLLVETVNKPEERKKHIENMMLSLPTGSKKGEEEEAPPVPAPKPKRKKGKKARKPVVRKHTESTTSEEDTMSHDLSESIPV